MALSDGRQNSLSHILADDLLKGDLLSSPSREALLRAAKAGIARFVSEWEELDRAAQAKIQSLKRGVIPGSSEWDLLYSQYLEDGFSRKSALFVKDRS